MMSRGYRPNFALKLMEKDLRYAITEAQHLGVSLETAHASRGLFQIASDGWADQPPSSSPFAAPREIPAIDRNLETYFK
jgi:3-hydroxyisobutyrate dehydrogenase-like beta-hydroxyacid dehydrogenase